MIHQDGHYTLTSKGKLLAGYSTLEGYKNNSLEI